MTTSSRWGVTPRQSVEREAARRGRDAVIEGCRVLVRGEAADPALVLALGGPPARTFLDGQPHADDYWLKVWGLRGLLWLWSPDALSELRVALVDPAWRVREMALKVATRNGVDDVLEDASALQADPVLRVRRQSHRYLLNIEGSTT